MTDQHPPPNPVPDPDDLDVDVRAFLPEGVALAGDGEPTADELDGRPEPEVPAWARDDAPAGANEAVSEDLPEQGADEEPIDVTALDAAEEAMAEVEDALAAIDAGDLGRSPLLVKLLAED